MAGGMKLCRLNVTAILVWIALAMVANLCISVNVTFRTSSNQDEQGMEHSNLAPPLRPPALSSSSSSSLLSRQTTDNKMRNDDTDRGRKTLEITAMPSSLSTDAAAAVSMEKDQRMTSGLTIRNNNDKNTESVSNNNNNNNLGVVNVMKKSETGVAIAAAKDIQKMNKVPASTAKALLLQRPQHPQRQMPPPLHYVEKPKSNNNNNKGSKKQPIQEIKILHYLPTIELVLFRLIGNPLPPLRSPEQTLQTLKYTLEHELEFPHLQKRWVLNRLIDLNLQDQLVSLLDAHDQDYIIIPFNLTEYDQVNYVFTYYQPFEDNLDVIHDRRYVKGKGLKYPDLVDAAIVQDKNVFVTNQNAARNLMIDIGQFVMSNVDWILPWDEDCFLLPEAYQSLYQALQAKPKFHHYAYTPIVMTTNHNNENDPTMTQSTMGSSTSSSKRRNEEPQLIFRKTALGRFHPLLRYGRRTKTEFLQRLGIDGPWNSNHGKVVKGAGNKQQKKTKQYFMSWEMYHLGPFLKPIPDLEIMSSTSSSNTMTTTAKATGNKAVSLDQKKNNATTAVVGVAGWATRVSSLMLSSSDHDNTKDKHSKGVVIGNQKTQDWERLIGLYQIFGQLDTKAVIELHGYRPGHQLMFYNEEALLRDRTMYQNGNGKVKPIVDELVRLAQAATKVGPWSVMDQDNVASNNNNNNNMLVSALHDMQYNTTILSLAYFMTGEKEYAQIAARNIRTWFLNPDTKMNSDLSRNNNRKNEEIISNKKKKKSSQVLYSLLEMKDFYFFLDAIRLVERDGFLSSSEQVTLRTWFSEYLTWMETEELSILEYMMRVNRGLYFDIQAVAVASYIQDTSTAIMYIEKSKSRLLDLIKQEDGSMPKVLDRPRCEHSQMLTLQGWSILSRLAQNVNRNPWHYSPTHIFTSTTTTKSSTTTIGGKTIAKPSLLCRASNYSIPYYGRKEVCGKSAMNLEENTDRWLPLFHDSQIHCPELQSIHDTKKWKRPSWFPSGSPPPPPQQEKQQSVSSSLSQRLTDAYTMPYLFPPTDGIAPFWNLGLRTVDAAAAPTSSSGTTTGGGVTAKNNNSKKPSSLRSTPTVIGMENTTTT